MITLTCDSKEKVDGDDIGEYVEIGEETYVVTLREWDDTGKLIKAVLVKEKEYERAHTTITVAEHEAQMETLRAALRVLEDKLDAKCREVVPAPPATVPLAVRIDNLLEEYEDLDERTAGYLVEHLTIDDLLNEIRERLKK